MAAIFQMAFLNPFPCMKIVLFWLKIQLTLFLGVQLTIKQLVQMMAGCQIHDGPLSEPMVT